MSNNNQTSYSDLLDNYFLFIHNIQLQQNNITTLNNTIHAALYSLLQNNIDSSRDNDYESYIRDRIHRERTSNLSYVNRNNRNLSQNLRSAGSNSSSRNTRRDFNTTHNNLYEPVTTTTTSPVNIIWPHTSSSFLNPVPVFPSSEQINQATTIESYGTKIAPSNTRCPIRNEDFSSNDTVIRINRCGHIFFINEFYGWFRENVRCPLCRRDIRNINGTIGDSTSESIPISTISLNDLSINDISSSSMTISTNDLSDNDNFNNRIDTIRNITQTLAQELENQLRMPIGDDISAANFELSVSFIDIINNDVVY